MHKANDQTYSLHEQAVVTALYQWLYCTIYCLVVTVNFCTHRRNLKKFASANRIVFL